jgi:hypothetical protein
MAIDSVEEEPLLQLVGGLSSLLKLTYTKGMLFYYHRLQGLSVLARYILKNPAI